MTPIVILLMLTCSGHVNAVCEPSLQYFTAMPACQRAKTVVAARGVAAVCFPSAFAGKIGG